MADRIFTYLKTAAPTVNDDTGDGYFVGDMWLDETNDVIYQAIDVTAGAAVWKNLSGATAADIAVTDSGGYFTGTEVETVLQEVGAGLVTVLEMGYIGYLSPADSTTYYSGARSTGSPATSANTRPFTIRRNGTIYAIDLIFVVDGTLASAETFTTYIRLNNTTDTTISSSCQMDAAYEQFSNAALSVAVASGDTVEIKMVTPAWATNPTNTRCMALVWMR